MVGAPNIRPVGSNILIERLEGHGIERVTAGGIVIPATNEARARTKNDSFRARVLAVGPAQEANPIRDAVAEGFDHVLVYTWADNDDAKRGLYTGTPLGQNRLFVKPDDIIIALAADAQLEARNSDAEKHSSPAASPRGTW